MEVGWVLLGLLLGVASTLGAILLRDRQLRRAKGLQARRELYARSLALNDAAYTLVEFLITWPRRVSHDAMPVPGERPTTRAAAIVNNTSVELEATVRRSREVASQIRLAGSSKVIPLAMSMHEALEEAVLALRVESSAKLDRRWANIGPSWRSAREAFADAARSEVADHP
ncbi:hypothetical protein BH23CHL10_BH23CHL10_10650 [soil metagenome]